MGKGEIAVMSSFSFSPQCFQKACFSEASKGVIAWEWVKFVTGEQTKVKQYANDYYLGGGGGILYKKRKKETKYLYASSL